MKRRISLALALALPVFVPNVSQAAPFVVAGSVTIEGGTHTFTEQVIVTPGSTLTVKDATIYLDAPASCPIGGTFKFCHPQLFVMPGATLVTDGATFDTNLPFSINPASGGYLILAYAGVLEIDNTTFRHANTVGGELAGPRTSTIRNSTFVESLYPITLIRGMEGIIEDNTIVDSRQGIHIRDSNSVVRGNSIEMIGYGIDIQSTQVGAQSEMETRVIVENNVVTGGVRSFFNLSPYQSTVRNNVFSDAQIGAVLGLLSGDSIPVQETIVFENNTLLNNVNGLATFTNVHGGQEVPREIIVPAHQNSIEGTTCSSVIVTAPNNPNIELIMDARENWWGSESGPQSNGPTCPAANGLAYLQPWLTAPPA